MKKALIISSFAAALAFGGCKDYLDQVPNDRITIEEVFKKKEGTEQYLANVYSYVPDLSKIWDGFPWVANSDELEVSWVQYPTYRLGLGNLNAGTVLFDTWGMYYRAIRSATYFINNVDGNTEILALNGQELIDQYKAEARFLRAYYYTLLMQQFGPVVLLGETELPADAPADAMQTDRSPYDSCVNYVVSELDKAAAVLPLLPSRNGQVSDLEYGRATKGMALAVKARLLLYAASPQYNGNTDYANFKTKDGKQFIAQQFDREKWRKAAEAAKDVIDLGIYSLYQDPGGNVALSLQDVYFKAWNSEQIFVRKSNDLSNFDVHAMPRSAGGWSGLAPTQEIVDAYFMNDGLSIQESPNYSESGFTTVNGVQVSNMYINREPRFYAHITYNNSRFQGGNMQAAGTVTFFKSGPNGRDGHATDYSKTGYLIRKNVGPLTNVGSGGTGQRQNRPLAIIRLAEVYLNYVEALNEYDPTNSDIVTYLNLIRKRAGVPMYGEGPNALPVPASPDAMRAKIRAERRVELAFESHRWFDIRRWKIVASVMGDLHGMDINQNGNDFYKRVVATRRVFRNEFYWFPISQYEMDRGRQLTQNPGW
ncbi:RagB/SusD family nutrient uptake outer membrane protein [Chitinophaga horti]|uniref:RagB/SusD family nutrient uptake outer membrane protein n=1 Tax=Chitinophaga horti TaxID=2920382 RepID=A0ABY6JCC1_9BACT|nr:RagB/SusD family nutrient uptake outer membrane protein [Chitinophaga horti]UYQ95936.1 RagB/SusD family nutrient uptake outer membrane protein [Chitinophaga horti]